MRKLSRGCLCVLLLLVTSAASRGVTTKWNAGTGDWQTGSNWTAGVPTATVNAQVANGGTAQLMTGTGACAGLYVGWTNGTSGTVDHSGGSLTVNGTLYMTYGAGSTGTYLLSGSGQVTGPTTIVGHYGPGTRAVSSFTSCPRIRHGSIRSRRSGAR